MSRSAAALSSASCLKRSAHTGKLKHGTAGGSKYTANLRDVSEACSAQLTLCALSFKKFSHAAHLPSCIMHMEHMLLLLLLLLVVHSLDMLLQNIKYDTWYK